jgi:CHASE3 domain sensor protein
MLDDEDGLDVPQEVLDEYEKAKKEFDAVQKKLYNLRKEQKGF